MKVIAGLGNPGAEYANTPHSIGFEVVDALARSLDASWKRSSSFNGELAQGMLGGVKVLLVKPQTFMNLSGDCVAPVVRYHNANAAEDLLVVSDDIDLPVGKMRIRKGGSAGGHNGLKSIDYSLASDDYARLRIGTGNGGFADGHQVDFVLGDLLLEEKRALPELLERAVAAIKCCSTEGIDRAMTQFNKVRPAADDQSASSSSPKKDS